MLDKIITLLDESQKNDLTKYAIEKLNDSFAESGYKLVKSRKQAETEEKPASTHVRKGTPVTIGTTEYPSLNKACQNLGISASTVHNYARVHNCSKQDALVHVLNADKSIPRNAVEMKPVELTIGGQRIQ